MQFLRGSAPFWPARYAIFATYAIFSGSAIRGDCAMFARYAIFSYRIPLRCMQKLRDMQKGYTGQRFRIAHYANFADPPPPQVYRYI